MKKLLLFTGLISISLSSFAQTCNAVLFTEQGERFSVILNGARQNEKPETQVKVTGLNAEAYKMKVIFEDATLGSMDKTLYLLFGTERSYSIKKNKKGEYVLRMISETPLAQLPPPTPQQTVVVYNPNPAPAVAPAQINTGMSVTESTTTTTTGTSENVNVGVNMGGVGFNMNVNINDGMGMPVNSTTTTTTYSSTTSGTTTNVNAQPAPVPAPVYVLPGYNGPVGCPLPMSPADFNSAKGSISSKSFEDSKLQIAKQIINSNCLLSSQVKEIMMLFSFENSKLDFAKYAYGYTFDIGNYFKVNDAFDFELSIDDLNEYIGSR